MKVSAHIVLVGALALGCGESPGVSPYDSGIDPVPDGDTPASCRSLSQWTRAAAPVQKLGGGTLSAHGAEADPFVREGGDGLEMWFSTTARVGEENQIRLSYATSSDGITWTDVVEPVLEPGPGEFDGLGVETASVVTAAARDHRLFYAGDRPPEGSDNFAIGVATSTDARSWSKRITPVLPPQNDWEQPFCDDPPTCTRMVGGTLEPSVLRDPDTGGYTMWYAALGKSGDVIAFRIGMATSPDGENWTRRPDPVFEPGPSGSWDDLVVSHTAVMVEPSGGYHLFYHGSSAADYVACEGRECVLTPGSIGHAFSADGITWVRDPANPILTPESGWDGWFVGGPSPMIRGDKLWLWYTGSPGPNSLDIRIGLAQADCGA